MRCPRCHQPLDFAAEGLYVCCAGAARRWRCTSCQAAHDGFAFAYGACPGCGGRLVAADETAPDDAVLAGVRMAFEIELGGRAFYQRAAADSRDAQMRALFERFAAMEGEHMETLSHRYHVRTAEASAPLRLELAALFGGVEHRPQDPDNLFRIAVAIERRAARLFTEHADRADSGSTDGELFRELAAEEVEHAVYLDAEHQRWRAGQPVLTRHGAALQAPVTQAAPINAAELLLGGHDAGQGALQCGEHRISRGALREWAARCAAVWAARGLRPGDRVAIKLPDGLDWVAAFMGCLWAGVVAVAVNPRIPRSEWQYILDEAGFSVILAETDNDDDTPEPWRARVLPLDAWRAECERRQPVDVQPMQPDAPALWCHSSGTSGQPKAVVHAHRFALEVDRVSREGLGVRSGERVFATSKLFFAYPQTNALFAGLKLGATVILDPLWPTAQSVAATVAAQRPHVLFSVPSLYRNLLHEGDLAQDMARHGVRLCVSAGEALPRQLRRQWQDKTGLPIVDGYGASETLVLVMLARDGEQGFVPSPGVDIEPLDAVPAGVPTRLLIRAPTLALGYLDRPRAQAETFRDGAFCPADLWQRDAAGGWQFAGREDSLVKIRGRWVNLIELAEQLAAHAPHVLEGAAVCVPDGDGVDAVAYFYVAADTAAGTALSAHVETLPQHRRPRWLHAVDGLPRGPTGKLLRRKLQELHAQRV